MKHLLLLPSAILLFASCNRDTRMEIGEFRNVDAKERTIDVTGSSETYITPDQVTVTFHVRQYYKYDYEVRKNKDDENKLITVDLIEEEFREKLGKLGVKPNQVHIKSINSGWTYYWDGGRRRPVEVHKTYEVVFHSLGQVDSVIPRLEVKGIQSANITSVHSSKERELRKQVKIDAIKAAKEKAQYMLAAVGKEPGELITIREVINDNNTVRTERQGYHPYYGYYGDYWPYWWGGYGYGSNSITTTSGMNGASNSAIGSNGGMNGMPSGGEPGNTQNQTSARDVKLRYEVEATFEIKQKE
ncbi:MAG: hypothetical protein FD123_4208 [Bacteroidetes bacterium]|nr:MAG: hypothetical protein FD123_4208 [Bacteroidota bacterium]